MWKLLLIAASVAALMPLVLVGPAQAAIEITTIQFNAYGRDRASNQRLNGEWIRITNTGRSRRDLKGWTIHDRNREHIYRFRDRTVLGRGQYVYLHTGRGKNTQTDVCTRTCRRSYYTRYWDLAEPVWDNESDRATLRNREGQVVDRCRYFAAASSPKRC